MASTITVTPAELKNKASELKQFNSNLKTQIEELRSQEGALIGKWEGDAKTAFDAAFKNDMIQMDNFYNAIERYVAALQEITTNTKQNKTTENTNTSIATERKY